MSDAVKHGYTLFNNVFLLHPLIIAYFKKAESVPKSALLSYLIFPLVLYEPSREFLVKSSKASALRTFTKKKERIFGLEHRVSHFKNLTNKSLQISMDHGAIEIDNELRINCRNQQIDFHESIENQVKASEKLVNIFKGHDVVTIYRQLGIKQL